jgi:transmembrane sensor
MNYSKKDIDRFFEGKLSKNEAKKFLDWLDSPAGEDTYNNIIEGIWANDLHKTESPQEKEDIHIPVLSKPKALGSLKSNTNDWAAKKKAKLVKFTYGMAASLIMVLGVSYIFYSNTSSTPELEEPVASISALPIERTTQRGIKKLITLPDGSTVILNADSKLIYFEDFANNRTLKLEGEGFFEVVKDEFHPFTVITENISTTALGTSFNIKAYQGNPNIQVTLATGKVRVENSLDQNLFEIQPGEAVYYFENKNTLKKQNADLSQVLSWKEGILQFDKIPFNVIVKDLERWYGVNIVIKGTNTIPEYKCSGTFPPHEYLSNVLKVLSFSVNFDYTINGNEVLLEFK